MPRSVRRLLQDMVEYSARCQKHLGGKSYLAYCNDDRTRLATERCLSIVGEALSQVLKQDLAVMSAIPDAQRIVNLRHRLIHSYYDIDGAIVWSIVEDHLPGLVRQAHNLLAAADEVEEHTGE